MTRLPHHHDQRLPERLARVESEIPALRSSIDSLGQQMSSGFAELKRSIPSGRTDWGILAAWAGVILLVVGMVGGVVASGFDGKIGANAEDVRGIRERELEQAENRGRYAERIDNHGETLTALDATLQREMRLLDGAMEAKLVDLDGRLQGEIARAAHVGEEDRTVLREAVDRMRALQEALSGITAEHTQRLHAIERQVFEGETP